MRTRELIELGFPYGEAVEIARRLLIELARSGVKKRALRAQMTQLGADPKAFVEDKQFGALARTLVAYREVNKPYAERHTPAPYRQWGEDLDPQSVEQMNWACKLPIAQRGALMPDAHLGYGLPIGGVLATKGAVIPYAVGVDIACRVKMTVLDLPVNFLETKQEKFKKALVRETQFGMGAKFNNRRSHEVLDRDWSVSPITQRNKDKAWSQLGTSGSGNHFVDFGRLTIKHGELGIPGGTYLALLSHSGSRGTGAQVCQEYSKRAMVAHPGLPRQLKNLAWLELGTSDGDEYWAAMQLMGAYASANHECIHRHIREVLGAEVLLDIENHHNFAWKEEHNGEELIVHRKGATPAGEGMLGLIPGTMATPAYVVRGLGEPASLNSAAHGAGRVMSRKHANRTLNWDDAKQFIQERGVTLLSAGLDEVPAVYKDINQVMAAQTDLVEPLAQFHPKLVRMAEPGERAED
jgi:tRNA-splicing ligase RtcB